MTAVEVVRYLMEENSLTQVDLAPLFGGQSRVSDFLAGKRSLSNGQIEKLSERFDCRRLLSLLVRENGKLQR